MARQHGYHILIPAFIPVDKKSLENQITTGRVIFDAAQEQSLDALMALPGIRYNAKRARDGSVKEMFSSWGSVEIEDAQPGTEKPGDTSHEHPLDEQAGHEEQQADAEFGAGDMIADEPEADPATTTGRRSRAKVA